MKIIFLILIFFLNISTHSSTITIDYLKSINNDIIGILYIPNIITIPLVKTNNNTYYLDYDIYNNKDIKGSIYADYRSTFNKMIIYGHSSNVLDIPFNNISNYLDNNYLNNNRYIYIFVNDTIYTYYINNITYVTDEIYYESIINNNNFIIQTCYKDGFLLLSGNTTNND